MAYLLTDMLRLVRAELQDSGESSWSDGELEPHIKLTLMDIDEASPYEVKETVTLTSASPFVDVSTITDLIEVIAAYYPITDTIEYFKNKRNVERFGNTIRIETTLRPSGNAEEAYLECEKKHTLTELVSTLNSAQEKVLVLGSASRAARSKSRTQINRQNVGGGKVPINMMTWGQLEEAKFRAALAQITKQRTCQLYPRN